MPVKINKLTLILLWVVRGSFGKLIDQHKITDSFIIYAYVLLGIAILITLFFTIRNFVLNPKGLRLSLIALGIAVILIGIAALLADNTVLDLPHYKGKDNVPRTLFLTDIGLYVAYFLFALSFLAIIYSVISQYFKK
jgi:hypothetical protein